MTTFATTPLYGGAITVDLPTGYGDVSQIRQVPDNQEVYLDSNGLTSIIFDITEHVGPDTAATDEEALKYHFNDIVEAGGIGGAAAEANETTTIYLPGHARLARMPTTPAYALLATQQITAPSHSGRPTPDFVGILMILVRLAQQQTDIVIMVNVPHVAGEYLADQVDFAAARLGPLMQKGVEIRDKILETFDIKDWELFVNE